MIYRNCVLALFASLFLCSSLSYASTENTTTSFTPKQKEDIGKIATQYLIEHPEFLIIASQKLQERQYEEQQQVLVSNAVRLKEQLADDQQTPQVGPKNAKVAVVEFFDYQCVYCSRMSPIYKNFMKKNPSVRFIFKEFPIFGDRWPSSEYAAEMGYLIYQQYGEKTYSNYHSELFGTGKVEGKLTTDDVNNVIKKLDIKPENLTKGQQQAKEWIEKTKQLATEIGIQGTPAFVVLPTKNADANNMTVIPGFTDFQALQSAIKKAENTH